MKIDFNKNKLLNCKTCIMVAFCCFTFSTRLYAQCNNFSGTWVQTSKTSLSGKDYANGIPSKVNISQTGDQLTIAETSIIGQQGEDTTITETLTIDNQAKVKAGPHNKITILAGYSAGHLGFTKTTTVSPASQPDQKKIEITENWTLSTDGKTLTINKSFTNFLDPEDKWAMTGTYQKQ